MDDNNRLNRYDEGIEEERVDLDDDYQAETARELAEGDLDATEERDRNHDPDISSVYGWVAVALSVIAFFAAPVLFAAAGIIVGFISRAKSAPVLGNTAIGIGIVALVVRFLIMPMF